MHKELPVVLHGVGYLSKRTRIQCTVKSTFSETKLAPGLNDILIANPSPAAVSRFRMGWLSAMPSVTDSESGLVEELRSSQYGTVTRFGGISYDVERSLNVWSSGIWISTATGSTAAMHAAGGRYMDSDSNELQYLIREHIIEANSEEEFKCVNNQIIKPNEQVSKDS